MTRAPAAVAVRPPAIARARRDHLVTFARLYRFHPRDTGRLRVWEFWDLVAGVDAILKGGPGG